MAVLQSTATVEHGTTDLEWEQVYKGIARGLGGINDNVTECVEDGNRTVETFRDAFTAFENREIFEGVCVYSLIHMMFIWELSLSLSHTHTHPHSLLTHTHSSHTTYSPNKHTHSLRTGLHLFAQGLSDVRDALVQCDETVIVDDLSQFITDLISCTEGHYIYCNIIVIQYFIMYGQKPVSHYNAAYIDAKSTKLFIFLR